VKNLRAYFLLISSLKITSKKLNKLYETLNNDHLADSENCLIKYSLCHYIDSECVEKFCYNFENNSINFTTLCLNIRSIVNQKNFNLFESWFQSLKFLPDVIAINETWEKNSSTGQFKNLHSYNYVSNFRKSLSGSGVALYIKKPGMWKQ